MRKILNLCLVAMLFTSCSSEKLDRETALQLIQDKKYYPKIISYNVFIADPTYAKRMLMQDWKLQVC